MIQNKLINCKEVDSMRPCKMSAWIKPEYINMIANWARRGLTHQEIADKMYISLESLMLWRKKSATIREATDGREMALCQVENAMYRDALGFYYTEQVVTNKGDVVELTKYKLPSLPAQIFYLKNRLPKYWADKRDINYTDDTVEKIIVKWGRNLDARDRALSSSSSTSKDASEPGKVQD